MAKKIKVLATNIGLYGDVARKADALREKYGVSTSHNQFRCICGCTSMADANRQMEEAGMSAKFTSAYTSETGNEYEVNLAKEGGIFIEITKGNTNRIFVTVEELKKPLEEIKVIKEILSFFKEKPMAKEKTSKKTASFRVKVNNVKELFGGNPIDPDTFAKYPFVVVRVVNGEVWYYGSYENEERAKEVIELEKMDNGFIVDGNSVEYE